MRSRIRDLLTLDLGWKNSDTGQAFQIRNTGCAAREIKNTQNNMC
jgi:hypothetical protein